mmetsp:Transcript_10018/g.20333  ORF Transcript_10018/g.20333 Transcript_10018/m.20333 type:complete len:106 (-) Transcript_10018:89-406(-)
MERTELLSAQCVGEEFFLAEFPEERQTGSRESDGERARESATESERASEREACPHSPTQACSLPCLVPVWPLPSVARCLGERTNATVQGGRGVALPLRRRPLRRR